MISMTHNTYGKGRVRLMKLHRGPERTRVVEMTIKILLEGDLVEAHVDGDNSKVLPTDTMKNTVYALGRKHEFETAEQFGLILARHFLNTQSQLTRAKVEVSERLWQHIPTDAGPHPHSFAQGPSERPVTFIDHSRDATTVRSGVRDLLILKTSDSGFSDFIEDEYTTLKATEDRIFATSLESTWRYAVDSVDFAGLRKGIRNTLLTVFSEHKSLSVQQTLYAMGEAALEKFDEINEIHILMPNKHCLHVDLSAFGMDNPNKIFHPIDEPFGIIEATLKRG